MEAQSVSQIITLFLEKLGVRGAAVECRHGAAHPTYQVTTDEGAVLIGVGGENLKALNVLVKAVIEKQRGAEATKFLLDVNGYQIKRLGVLEQQAKVLAERARTFKTDVEMSPVNAYERMIIHNLFTRDPDITTESKGAGKQRRIVFRYQIRATARSEEDF